MPPLHWMNNLYNRLNDAAASAQGHALTVQPSAIDNYLSLANKYVDPVTNRKALVSFYTPLPKGVSDVPAAVPKVGIMRGGPGAEWGAGSAFVVPLIGKTQIPQIVSDTHTVVDEVWNQFPYSRAQWFQGTWEVLKKAVGYIGFTYNDFVEQWTHWDKTMSGLVQNFELWWRIFVTAVITYGIYEMGIMFDSFGRIIQFIWEAIQMLFNLSKEILQEMWNVLTEMLNHIVSIFE